MPERNIRIKTYPLSELLRRHSWPEERWQWKTGGKKLSELCFLNVKGIVTVTPSPIVRKAVGHFWYWER